MWNMRSRLAQDAFRARRNGRGRGLPQIYLRGSGTAGRDAGVLPCVATARRRSSPRPSRRRDKFIFVGGGRVRAKRTGGGSRMLEAAAGRGRSQDKFVGQARSESHIFIFVGDGRGQSPINLSSRTVRGRLRDTAGENLAEARARFSSTSGLPPWVRRRARQRSHVRSVPPRCRPWATLQESLAATHRSPDRDGISPFPTPR